MTVLSLFYIHLKEGELIHTAHTSQDLGPPQHQRLHSAPRLTALEIPGSPHPRTHMADTRCHALPTERLRKSRYSEPPSGSACLSSLCQLRPRPQLPPRLWGNCVRLRQLFLKGLRTHAGTESRVSWGPGCGSTPFPQRASNRKGGLSGYSGGPPAHAVACDLVKPSPENSPLVF